MSVAAPTAVTTDGAESAADSPFVAVAAATAAGTGRTWGLPRGVVATSKLGENVLLKGHLELLLLLQQEQQLLHLLLRE